MSLRFWSKKLRPRVAPRLEWWHGIVVGVLAACLPGPALVLAIYMVPLALIYATDPLNEPYRVVCAAFFIIAAFASPAHTIWLKDADWDACLAAITNRHLLLLDWCAAGLAWIIMEISMMVWRLMRAQQYRLNRKALQKRAADLREEWGFAVPENDKTSSA